MHPARGKHPFDEYCVEIDADSAVPAHAKAHLAGLAAGGAFIAVRTNHAGEPSGRPSMGPFFSSKRRVMSFVASFRAEDISRPFAQGSFRFAAKGTFVGGPGDVSGVADAVGKWFKNACMQNTDEHYLMDLKTSQKAIELVSAWNDLARSDRHFFKRIDDLRPACARPASIIQVIEPQLWKWAPSSRLAGQSLIIEPFLPNFGKWNSNSGWQSNSAWGQVMAALSHYSYHVTGGELLLCDLQGGVSDRAGCILTDPVICSRERSFGLTDVSSLWSQTRPGCFLSCVPTLSSILNLHSSGRKALHSFSNITNARATATQAGSSTHRNATKRRRRSRRRHASSPTSS